MQDEDIVLYLQQHPYFFENRNELLETLSVTHPTGGKAISLIERQLFTQREKLEIVQNKLAELIAFGEENDAISAKVHKLARAFLMMTRFESTVEVLYSLMQESFSVPHVALRIWGNGLETLAPEVAEVGQELREAAQQMLQPYCGPLYHSEVRSWFGEAGTQISSVALIVLRREGNAFGLLALGSEDENRFFPDMGTLYIEQIGELTSAALLRYLN